MIVEFGEWLPDYPDYANPGAITAKNVYPFANGYKQVNALTESSNALTARCQGAYSCRDQDGNTYNFAGDATKLYSLDSGTFTDASRLVGGAYGTISTEAWEFTRYGQLVVATNWTDNPQSITLGGANFAVLTTALKARHVATVDAGGGFIFFGNTYDGTDGNVPHRVRWSAENGPTDYTYSVSTGADYQDLPDDGWVQRIIGGEWGTVFQEYAINRFTYTGASDRFQRDKVESRGTPAPGSVVRLGTTIFYLSHDGFYQFDGQTSTPIGKNKVDKWFYTDLDDALISRVSAVVDPFNSLVIWAYPGVGNSGNCSKLLFYNWSTQRWSYAEMTTEILTVGLSSGYTLDSLDALGTLDSLVESLDSRSYTGGSTILNAFSSSHKIAELSGAALTATIDSKEAQLTDGGRSMLRAIKTLVDGGTHAVKVAIRNNLADTETWSDYVPQAPSGRFATRQSGRYHRIRVEISGGFTDALGVDLYHKARGKR